ncbi:FAD-binding oxidoreductase [Undibacterium sp. TS12]|uniref:FAD-binding oxidoreductase n=1 Tax=Undibacterium sp. TS12 TaxID=2908202 RepID=UPI001F4C5EAF|nr:FAD-binding oxidoreductase [Undibacterium sp. TS12]MCH8622977.1 FAD-binding oxidoreductase [Undibacterium sp. TS12]
MKVHDYPLSSLGPLFAGRLLTEASETAPFLTDWRGRWCGRAMAVAQPDTAKDVAAIVRWCHEHKVPLVPQGGNTGLSGGSVPDDSGRALLLSLTRLNRVRAIDPFNLTLTAEAGCTLQQVQQAAAEAGYLFPLSLAAEGSCSIGGNLATNAGGVQVLRYGNARELCLGLEVVTPEGELWNGLRGLRKDNTGYDLRDLYIGSEGTLGVITAAVLKLYPVPAAQLVGFVAVPSPEAALRLLTWVRRRLGAGLTAFELLTETCLGLVLRHIPGTRRPLNGFSPWYVLLEISDTEDEHHARQVMESLLETALENELVSDAVLSTSLAQAESLWAIRENISESQAAEGKNIKHDISLPISSIPRFIAETDAAIARQFPGVRMVVFGHLGDGNLHYNVSPAEERCGPEHAADFVALEAALNRLVHDAVASHAGSISAEHGLGVLRRDESARYKTALEQKLMRTLKNAFDPHGLMNPGKLIC